MKPTKLHLLCLLSLALLCWPSISWGQNTQIDPTQVRGGVGGGGGAGIPFGVGGGTVQVQTVTTVPNITSWTNGQWISWAPVGANTGPGTTLTADGLAAVTITKCGTLPLVNGDIQTNPTAYAQYDAINVVLNLQNPVSGCPGLPITAGTANVQTVTITPPVTGHVPGAAYNVLAGVANTGAMTLNIGGGVWNVTKCNGVALIANDWPLTTPKTIMIVVDDGTELQLLNPQAAGCGAAGLAPQYKQLRCVGGLGDGLNVIPAGTYLQSSCYNDTSNNWQITGVKCYTDAGTSTLNVVGFALGTVLAGPITCTSSWNAGTLSGSGVLGAGDYLKFTFVADGVAKQTTWLVSLTQ
jgi:hypothetical protein